MPLVVQADQMLKEMNSAQHTDYDADALPLLLLQVLPTCLPYLLLARRILTHIAILVDMLFFA